MYAVILNRGLFYLGNDYDKAIRIHQKHKNSCLHYEITLNELSSILGFTEPEVTDEHLSQAVQCLVQKLKDLGIKVDVTDKVKESSEKVLAEVKFVGLRGMKTVGDGFVALGDLLRKAGENKDNTEGNENVESDC